MSLSRFAILNISPKNEKTLLRNFKKNQKHKKPPCPEDRYECLLKIYNELKTNPIFKNVFPFIQGGFALYLYGYNDIMRKYPILGTDDIDIHIEPISGKTLDSYNKELQNLLIGLCKKYNAKLGLNKISGKWYYGTSEYCDITYEDNYSSLKLYIEYYLANGNTKDELEKHLVGNDLLLPLEYVKFNCIHMFCILLDGFNTHSLNNRIPKTLKILKRVLMIYDYKNYEIFDKNLDEYLNALLKIITQKKLSKKNTYEMDKINEQLQVFCLSFISKSEIDTTKMLVFLIEKLNIKTLLQTGGSIYNSNTKLSDSCFYNNNELIQIKNNIKNTDDYNNFILYNNLCALIFKNIIFYKMKNTENTKSIIKYFNITIDIDKKNNTNTKTNTTLFQYLPKSIPVYGGFKKQFKTMKTRKYQVKLNIK
jgi:hypothetical protein